MYLPTIDALYKDENLVAEHEELAKFYPQFATAHPRPQLADYSEWSNTVQPLFSAALSGSTSIEDALNQDRRSIRPLCELNREWQVGKLPAIFNMRVRI